MTNKPMRGGHLTMTEKSMTVGDLRKFIKELPDEMPLYMDDEHEIMKILSMRQNSVALYNEDLDDDVFAEGLIVGVS